MAYVVLAIDTDCASYPVGALKLSPTHEMRYDESFQGLSITDAAKLSNYQHFRSPLTEEKREYIGRTSKTILKL